MSFATSVFLTLMIIAIVTWHINRPVSIAVLVVMTYLFPMVMTVMGLAVLAGYVWNKPKPRPRLNASKPRTQQHKERNHE
jgi:hypothetical protein